MATFKAVILKGQINVKGETNIKVLITHKRKTAYLSTKHYVKPTQMGKDGKVKYHPNAPFINKDLGLTILEYQRKILQQDRDINSMTVKDIKDLLTSSANINIDFYAYAEKRIEELKKNGKQTYISYGDSINRLKEYAKAGVLPFSNIDKRFLEGFEQFCREKGRKINSIAIYMRSIRAIFYSALDELNQEGQEPYIKNNPFRKYKIKIEPTKKRSLDIGTIIKIRDAELTNPHEIVARDIFILQFYLIGINIKDLFYYKLPVKDRIEYNRYKTKRPYSIKIEPEAWEIINKYIGQKYLLKFADNCGVKPNKAHVRNPFRYYDQRAFNKMVNLKLKDIASDLNITEPVSTYYARHSWATIARNSCGISKDDISLCLGHKDPSKSVTDIYLNESINIIDKSNRKVLDLLKQKASE